MINFDDYANEYKTEHNRNWSYIPNKSYRILIIGGSGSGKTYVLLNLIENQPYTDKMYLYAKDPYEAKYQYLINKRDPKAFIEYSNDMGDIYKNVNYYNPYRENKILIVFDDMIADMINNKKLNSIVPKLFIRGRKLDISLIFITQSYFKVPKNVRLSTTHIFIAKIPNKRELQQTATDHLSDISPNDFINIYRKCTFKTYSFFVNDAILASDNPLTLFRIWRGQKSPPTSFSPVTSTNVGIRPQNFLAFSFNPFDRLV